MLTLGGKPLLFDDGDQIQKFLDRYQPLAGLRNMCAPVTRANSRMAAIGDTHVGLPFANYPAPPPLALNQLYWPTGASRWAIGYFLMAKEDLDELGTSSSSFALEMNDVDDDAFSITLYILESRPISAGDEDQLVLLTLVDERYWWQFKSIGDVSEPASWSAAFASIGLVTAPTVSADYLIPDATEIARRYENAAVLLDAMAASVGQRVVRKFDGTTEVVTAATSTTRLTSQIDAADKIAGGMVTRYPVPAQVRVVFPKIANGCLKDGEVYTKTANAPSSLTTVASMTKIIHSTAYADVSTDGSTIDNQSALDTLAAKIGADYYAWLGKMFDVSYAGLYQWEPTGFDDHLLFDFGQASGISIKQIMSDAAAIEDFLEPIGRQTTRVQSLPVNFGSEQQLSQGDGIINNVARMVEFELTEALTTADEYADASVVKFDQGEDPDPNDAGIEVVNPETTTDDLFRFEGASGARGSAYLITVGGDIGKYRILQMDCEAEA
jgi:hypothetical protein